MTTTSISDLIPADEIHKLIKWPQDKPRRPRGDILTRRHLAGTIVVTPLSRALLRAVYD